MSEDHDGERAPFYGELAPGWEFYRRTGARLTEDKHPALIRSGDSPAPVQHEAWHRFDLAHQTMLAEQGIVPTEAAARNLRGLRELEAEGVVEAREAIGHLAHSGEAYLISEIGEETAGWMHVGRSSVDLGAVGRRVLLREGLLDVVDAALDAIEATGETAAEYADAPMPIVTSARHSQVGTFGYYLLAWTKPLVRAIDRLEATYGDVNRSPAGSAAGTTTDFPIDRERTADLLGFDGVADNALDATRGDTDVVIDLLAEFTAVAGTVAVAADHLVTWGGTEFDLVDHPDRYFSTSSILTHKTNPRALSRVQGAASSTVSTLMDSYVGLGHVGGHRARASTAVFDSLVSSLELWTEVVPTLEFDRERGEELVYSDWGLAPDLAGQMVREEGINWRWAHQIAAILVRQAEEDGTSIREVGPAEVDRAAREYLGEPLGMSRAAIDEVVDAHRAVEARSDVTGSPAPSQVERGVADCLDAAEAGREWVRERRAALDAADDRLERAVDDVIEEVDLG